MRLVKLDRRYHAYKRGFRVAVEFRGNDPYSEFEQLLSQHYPEEPIYYPQSWTSWRRKDKFVPGRPYGWRSTSKYIAVLDEQLITLILLQMT